MRRLLPLVASSRFSPSPLGSRAAEPDTRVYEMRVYYAAPGKLDALNARFKNHTMKLFEKHGLDQRRLLRPGRREQGQQARLLDLGPEQGGPRQVVQGVRRRPGLEEGRGREREGRQARRQDRVGVPDRDRLLAAAQARAGEGRSRVRAADLHRDEGQPRPPQRPLQEPHAQAVREARHDERGRTGTCSRARRATTRS